MEYKLDLTMGELNYLLGVLKKTKDTGLYPSKELAQSILDKFEPQILDKITVGDFLASPCKFCGYSGDGYWEKGTHSKECLFYRIEGDIGRANLLEGLDHLIETQETSAAYKNMMAEIEKDES